MDGRSAKVRLTEIRELDRKLSPQQQRATYTNSSSDHAIIFDNRLLRDFNDARDMATGIRELKEEIRVMHSDVSCRGNEKDFRFDGASGSDFRGSIMSEKDWTKLTENNPAKRYSKSPNDISYSWRPFQQGAYCVGVGENDLFLADVESKGQVVTDDKDEDPKSEDKLKEKARERKDWRYKDSGEKLRHNNDNRSNMQSVSNGKRKLVEEREADKWARVTSSIQNDNEGKEKNPVQKEAADATSMECLPYGKRSDGPEMVEEQGTLALESRKRKNDFTKGFDGEFREKKEENNLQFDGGLHEIRDRYDNESEDGSNRCGAAEKDGEFLGHGFRQCKKIKHSRGSPNNNRKLPFISETCDHERIQGKAEVPTIVYKPGESVSKIYNLWKEFEASSGNKSGKAPSGPILDIRIPPKYLSSTNRQLRYAQMWGTDVYTDDSDVVAVLIHSGYCRPLSSPLPAAIDELRATIRVLPPQDCYFSSVRNNIHSRGWGSSAQCSYCIESCSIVKKGGETIELEPHFTRMSGLEPTIVPLPFERTMITRAAAASNALNQQKFVREVSVQYNLCNEPWIKYSINIVADKGMRKPLYTSARLKKGEVLYLETQFNRYELCFNGEKTCDNSLSTSCDRNATDGENIADMFRWSRCKKPLPEKMMHSIGIPLPTDHLVVLEENLDWEDIQWSQDSVWIAGKEYDLARVHFLSPK